MSGRLTALDIRIMLLELDLAETYRELPNTHAESIRHIRDMLLRASLGEVTVETEKTEAPAPTAVEYKPSHGLTGRADAMNRLIAGRKP